MASATDHCQIVTPTQLSDNDDESTNFLRSTPSSPTESTQSNKTMSTEKGRQKYTLRHTTNGPFFQHMTTIAHACLLLYVILIVYFCVSGEFQFFTWHPLLLSVGWMFLMTEAILTLSKDNLFTGTLPKVVRVRLHWIFQAIAVTLVAIGFTVVFVNKNNLNKTHFKTWHALLGFIGIVCTIPTCIGGIAALFNVDLRHYINPKINKFIHVTSGLITFSFGGLSLILSVYTHWFARHSNESIITFTFALIVVVTAVVWTVIRPITTCCNQLKHLL